MSNRLIVAAGYIRPDGAPPTLADPILCIFDDSGNELQRIFSGPQSADKFSPTCLAVTDSGDIFLGGILNPIAYWYMTDYQYAAFRKYSQDGSFRYQALPEGRPFVYDIAVDNNGFVYVAADGNQIYKYSADEDELIWTIEDNYEVVGGAFGKIAVDSSGGVYAPMFHRNGFTVYQSLRKYNSLGVKQWEWVLPNGSQVLGFVYDHVNDFLYVGSLDLYVEGNLRNLFKIDPDDGSIVASVYSQNTRGAKPVNILRIVDGDLHTIGEGGYKKYDLSLNEVSDFDLLFNVGDFSVDTDGQYYYCKYTQGVGYNLVNVDLTVKNGPGLSATTLWTKSGFSPRVEIIESPDFPSLPLLMALGGVTTQGDLYRMAPGLPLSMGLSAPRWILESTRRGIQTLYRLWLDDDALDSLALPLSSFSVRRTQNAASLSVVCPGMTDDLISAIALRTAGTLRLQSGFRYTLNMTVQYADFISAPLSSVRFNEGSSKSSCSLQGEFSEASPASNQTRAAQGMSYIGGASGARHWRCEPDIYLMPGDTLTWEGDSMIVGEMAYAVSTTQATMDVQEAG